MPKLSKSDYCLSSPSLHEILCVGHPTSRAHKETVAVSSGVGEMLSSPVRRISFWPQPTERAPDLFLLFRPQLQVSNCMLFKIQILASVKRSGSNTPPFTMRESEPKQVLLLCWQQTQASNFLGKSTSNVILYMWAGLLTYGASFNPNILLFFWGN